MGVGGQQVHGRVDSSRAPDASRPAPEPRYKHPAPASLLLCLLLPPIPVGHSRLEVQHVVGLAEVRQVLV